MSDFPSNLRAFRASRPEGENLEEFYRPLGVSGPTGSRYENGITEPPLSFLQRLHAKYGAEVASLMPGGYPVGMMTLPESQKGTVTGVLPEHVAEAYAIFCEAVEKAGKDIKKLDRKGSGLVIGLIAAEAAKGIQGEIRLNLVRRAETLLALQG